VNRRGPASIVEKVDFGVAELQPDRERPGGWTLLLDGYPQSYVDIGDPGHLEFEYVRRLASVVDLAAPLGEALTVLHLGGGALTMPRYVAATRPRSVQRVVEHDAALVALVRRVLPLPRGAGIKVRTDDARSAVEAIGGMRFDLVITDVYGAGKVPAKLATVEFATAVAGILRPGGTYTVNLADGGSLGFSRGQVATLLSVFPEVCLLAEPAMLRGRRFGNVVLVAAAEAGRLRLADLGAAAARDPFPARVVYGEDLERFAAGARPVTDATATDSPAPPERLF
jgi:spermidine synthase